MTSPKVSSLNVIAISISESEDMATLGLCDEHLREAMVEVARYVLDFGSRLVYGGDLRQLGFSELLFEIVARHKPVGNKNNGDTSVTNYLAWPVHIKMSYEEIEKEAKDINGSAELICLDIDGEPIPMQKRKHLRSKKPTDGEWARGLTAMRLHMLEKTKSRIILGGKTKGYKGAMPGVGEEALLSLNAGQPLFVIGGFGGCARDIAENLGLVKPRMFNHHNWAWQDEFKSFSSDDLNNGLSIEDNATLAITPHIDQVIVLILRGLLNILEEET